MLDYLRLLLCPGTPRRPGAPSAHAGPNAPSAHAGPSAPSAHPGPSAPPTLTLGSIGRALSSGVPTITLTSLMVLGAGCGSSSGTSNGPAPAANGAMTPWDTTGAPASDARGSGWHNVVVGGGGFIDGVVTHPSAAGLIYLRTDMGGAYRYDPAGPSWTPISDAINRADADAMGVLSLAIDPSDPERVYMMTGKYTQSWAGPGVVLISSDRGATWSRVPIAAKVGDKSVSAKVGGNEDGRGAGERLQVDPNLSSVLLMGTTRDGLWQSSDRAQTWSKVTSLPSNNVNFVLFDPASKAEGGRSARIFVGVADPMQSLWLSNDAGATWTPVAGQPSGLLALRAAIAGSTLYLTFSNAVGPNGATAGAVWSLDTGTLAWSKLLGAMGAHGFSGVSIDGKDPKHLVVSTLDRWSPRDEVFQTFDGGATWSPLLETATFDRTYAPYTAASTPHWLSDVKLDPADPTRMLFVTGYGLWDCRGLLPIASGAAADGGPARASASCSFANRGIEQTVAMQIVAPPGGAPLLSAMGDIDGFRHEQLDTSPASGRYQPLRGTTLAIASSDVVMTVIKAHNASPYGSYSRDGGVTWTGFSASPPGTKAGGTRSIALSADGQRIVWTPQGLGTFYSLDLGTTWQPSAGPMPVGLRPVADRKNPLRFLAVDAFKGDVYLSDDGGASFALGASGLVGLADYQLDDGSVAAAPNRENDDWLTMGVRGLFRSTDGGHTFPAVPSVEAAYRVAFGRAKADGGYPAVYLYGKVGADTGVFRSDDEGTMWTEVTDTAHKFGQIHDIAADPRLFGRVFVATEGRGVQFFQP